MLPRSVFFFRAETSGTVIDRRNQRPTPLNRRDEVLRVVLFSALAVVLNGPQLLAGTANTLMEAAIRRAKSIKSGHLEYRSEVGTIGPNANPPRFLESKVLSFVGSDLGSLSRGVYDSMRAHQRADSARRFHSRNSAGNSRPRRAPAWQCDHIQAIRGVIVCRVGDIRFRLRVTF